MPDDPTERPPAGRLVGWREWVSLPGVAPGVDVEWIKAKIDTGARTSAIHAFDLEEFEDGGATWVRFSVHPWQATAEDGVQISSPVLDTREVRSSNGAVEERYAVAMDVVLGGARVTTPVTLSNRDEMGFRMLIGREALAQGFLVDAALSYVGGRPPRAVRRRNRGR